MNEWKKIEYEEWKWQYKYKTHLSKPNQLEMNWLLNCWSEMYIQYVQMMVIWAKNNGIAKQKQTARQITN